MNSKTCGKCNRSLSLSDFHKNHTKKDGLNSECKDCAKKRTSDWSKKNRDKDRENTRKKYKKHREKRLEYFRERHANNSSLFRKRVREYRESSPEKYKAHNAVTNAITRLDLPHASGLVCESCQEAQAQQYHHHNGYAPEHVLDVVALCTTCHGEEHRINV